jgi:(p)ppGpp synthase/HD superfamily hydrolase
MGIQENDQSHSRRSFDVSGIDWDDEASIHQWARNVWTLVTNEWGNHMPETPSTVLTDEYTKAVAYATDLHASQTRKGNTIPYAAHLLGVSSLVLEAGGTQSEAIAGLLHDAVEDCGGLSTLEVIRSRFGDRVAEIVLACSDSTDEDWKRTVGYWERKQAYLDHLESTADERAVLVSMADKVHNARAIVTDLQRSGAGVLDKFNGRPEEILTYYVECLRIAETKSVPDSLLWPLYTAVLEIDEYVMGRAG